MFSVSFLLTEESPSQAFPFLVELPPVSDPLPALPSSLAPASALLLHEPLRQSRRILHHALSLTETLMRKRRENTEGIQLLEGFCISHFSANRQENDEEDFSPFACVQRLEKNGELDLNYVGQRASQRMAEESLPEMLLESEDADLFSHFQRLARAAKELCLFLLYQQKTQVPDVIAKAPALASALSQTLAGVYALDTIALYVARASAEHTEELLTIASREIAKETFLSIITALRELPSVEDVVEWRDNPFCRLRVLLDGLIYRS